MASDNQLDDQTLRDALLSVSAPDGLHQRVLERLRQAASADMTEASRHADVSDNNLEPATIATARVDRTFHRREWLGWALALSVASIALFGIYRWSQPASAEQLAQFTLGQLDRLAADETLWQSDCAEQLKELSVLNEQLRFNVRPVGFHDQNGGPFADQCRVWKFFSLTTNKAFYVFDFREASEVQSLTRQLQAIKRNSGGWSLVAMQSGDRLLVVIVEGALDSYIYQPQSA